MNFNQAEHMKLIWILPFNWKVIGAIINTFEGFKYLLIA